MLNSSGAPSCFDGLCLSFPGNYLARVKDDDPREQEKRGKNHPDTELTETPDWIIPILDEIAQDHDKEKSQQDRDEICPDSFDDRYYHVKYLA